MSNCKYKTKTERCRNKEIKKILKEELGACIEVGGYGNICEFKKVLTFKRRGKR